MAARRNERRAFYARVAELKESAGDERTLLRACVGAMRTLRDLPVSDGSLVRLILDDATMRGVLVEDDALARVRQAMNAPVLEAAYRATTTQRRKFSDEEIPAVTQLFTPRWVVEFLLHNTLGRLWIEMHPDTRLRGEWRYLIDRPTCRAVPKPARDLTVLDPACGTMNFGIAAVRMLRAMYLEELDRAGTRGWPSRASVVSESDINQSILANNLFGIDLDPVAVELADETLAIVLGRKGANLIRADALFDDLPTPWPRAFDVVVTNPPYLSSRNLVPQTVARMKKRYPNAWRDQCACFVRRCVDLCDMRRGRAGILAMQSFMFTGGYEAMRRELLSAVAIESIAHFGPGLFDVGNPGTLQTAAVVMRREPESRARDQQEVIAMRMVDAPDKRAALDEMRATHRVPQSRFTAAQRAAFTYWLDDRSFEIFTTLPKLAHIAPPKQGLATTDNARFVRYWWEVEPTCPDAPLRASPETWFPYAKSGQFRRWHESPRHRVNWADDGREIKAEIVRRYPYLNGQWQWVAKNARWYFKPGVTYSYLTSGSFSARLLPAGAIFDVAGSSLFPDDPLAMLAILNSSAARRLLHAINPTVNFQVGDLAELPVPTCVPDEARRAVARAIELTRTLDTFDETTPDFRRPMPWSGAHDLHESVRRELRAIELRIDLAIAAAYGLPGATDCADEPMRLDRHDLACRWISWAFRRVLESSGGVARVRPVDRCVEDRVREIIASVNGGSAVDAIEHEVRGIDAFLARGFGSWHERLYRRRPVVWIVGDAMCAFAVLHDFATRDVIRSLTRRVGVTVPRGWERRIDDGIARDRARAESGLSGTAACGVADRQL